jgi:hypothetical protein
MCFQTIQESTSTCIQSEVKHYSVLLTHYLKNHSVKEISVLQPAIWHSHYQILHICKATENSKATALLTASHWLLSFPESSSEPSVQSVVPQLVVELHLRVQQGEVLQQVKVLQQACQREIIYKKMFPNVPGINIALYSQHSMSNQHSSWHHHLWFQ